jgi:hypothetical protein
MALSKAPSNRRLFSLVVVGLMLLLPGRVSATDDENAYGTYRGAANGVTLSFKYTNKGIEDIRVNGIPVKGTVEMSDIPPSDPVRHYDFEFRTKNSKAKVWFSVLLDDAENVTSATALYAEISTSQRGYVLRHATGMVLRFEKCKRC